MSDMGHRKDCASIDVLRNIPSLSPSFAKRLFRETPFSQSLYITCVQGTFFARKVGYSKNNVAIVLAPTDSGFVIFGLVEKFSK
jgi:hypothetical protein